MRILLIPVSGLLCCLGVGVARAARRAGWRNAGIARREMMRQTGGQRQARRAKVAPRLGLRGGTRDVLGPVRGSGCAGACGSGNARRPNATRGSVRLLMLVCALLGGPASQALALPGPGEALRAYSSVRAWVDAGELPDELPGELPGGVSDAGGVPAVFGASVTLRVEGRVVGRGSVVRLEASSSVIRAAAQLAFDDARASGLHEAVWGPAAAGAGEPDRVRVSLELAGALVPLDAGSLVELTLGLSPGLDGVAVGRGDRIVPAFPGAMLARNAGPATAASALVSALSGDERDALEEPGVLRERGFRYFRFRTVHLAPPAGSVGPEFLHRGGRIIEPGSTTTREIVALADETARFLIARAYPGAEPYGMLGTLDPATGRSEPLFAGAFAQAVSAYALLRAGESRALPLETRESARASGLALLDALAVLAPGEVAPWDDDVSSAAVVAAAGLAGDRARATPVRARLLERCNERLLASFDPLFGFADALPEAARGVVAWGLVSRAVQSEDAGDLGLAQGAVRAAMLGTNPGELAAQMPFLAWGAIDLARVGAPAEAPIGTPALIAMRDNVRAHTINPEDVPRDERDLVGGVVFTRGAVPLPSVHALRPVSALAAMLGHPALTPGTLRDGSVSREIASMTRLLRFVRQLSVSEAEAHAYVRPESSLGGVRNALWDQRMRPESAALALLAACETLGSLEAIAAREP